MLCVKFNFKVISLLYFKVKRGGKSSFYILETWTFVCGCVFITVMKLPKLLRGLSSSHVMPVIQFQRGSIFLVQIAKLCCEFYITDLKSSKRSFCEGRPIHQRCVFKPKGRLKRCLVNFVWIRIFVVWVFPNSILSLIQMYCEGSARNSQWIVFLTTLSNQLPGKFSVSE